MRPALTVAALAEREGRFLLVEEYVQGRRVFNQPAGHVEQGESLLDAVIRETAEETGWDFVPEAVTGIYLWRRSGSAKTFLRVAFCGRCERCDTARELDHGIIQPLWLSRAQIIARAPALRSPMVLRSIDDYVAGLRRPCSEVGSLPLTELVRLATRL